MAESYEKLYSQGIASRAQLTERQLEVASLAAELEKLIAQQSETRAEIEKLKYDAFPYQRYGVRHGRVAWLSPAAVESKDGASFRAQVEIAESEMLVQGQSRGLAAGMSGRAEIVVGSRSLIEYVFEPLRQLKENFSDVPEQVSKR